MENEILVLQIYGPSVLIVFNEHLNYEFAHRGLLVMGGCRSGGSGGQD